MGENKSEAQCRKKQKKKNYEEEREVEHIMEDLEELKKTKKLTPKQEMFCQEYINTLSITEAYMKAYGATERINAGKLGSRLLKNDEIQRRVEEIRAETRENVKITREQLLTMAMQVYTKANEGKPEMKMNREGKFVPTGNTEYDFRAMNDAVKNIASILGYNSQNVKAEIEATTDVNVVSAKELAKELMFDD